MELCVTPDGRSTLVTISGLIDEHADFAPLAKVAGKVRMDLRAVRRFNSFGCRAWVDQLRELSKRAQITFVACSPAVIDQLNTTYGFLASGYVESFVGPLVCPDCDHEFEQLFDAKACLDNDGLPPVKCPKCGGAAELDDNPDQFLLFLREPTAVREPPR
jgi:anti-anti-sigma regulatory factor